MSEPKRKLMRYGNIWVEVHQDIHLLRLIKNKNVKEY